jgi:hypothetical protein
VTQQNTTSGSGSPTKPPLSEEQVDRTRDWTGLMVVVGGDVAIVVAAAIALVKFAGSTANTNNAVIASILASAFAAIGTMTTAYFGIRESGNTAQRSVKHQSPPSNS